MQLRTILFPTDFSHTGDAALHLATVLARDSKARLLIVHVEEPTIAYAGGKMYYGLAEPSTEQLKKMLEAVVPDDKAVRFEHRLVTGDPAHALIDLAVDENVDLIVMGTHGRTGLMRMLMGSVTELVVRRAPCPVLTYKQPSSEGAEAE
jgi:nucleotide-binding universal stress UspA family protein